MTYNSLANPMQNAMQLQLQLQQNTHSHTKIYIHDRKSLHKTVHFNQTMVSIIIVQERNVNLSLSLSFSLLFSLPFFAELTAWCPVDLEFHFLCVQKSMIWNACVWMDNSIFNAKHFHASHNYRLANSIHSRKLQHHFEYVNNEKITQNVFMSLT